MAKPFVGLDGVDSKGVRAEVWVQKGEGYVAEIKPPRSWRSSSGGDFDPNNTNDLPPNVSIVIKNSYLVEGVSGWVSTKDPIFDEALKAYNAKAEVSYRIEWQRKENIDRTTPVKELRGYNEQTEKSDMGMCNNNGVNIFAGLNNVIGKEAITNPAEDESGRRSALAQQPAAKQEPAAQIVSGPSKEDIDKALDRALKVGASEGIINAIAGTSMVNGGTPISVIYSTNNNDSLQVSYDLINFAKNILAEIAPTQNITLDEDKQMFKQTIAIAQILSDIVGKVQTTYFHLDAPNRNGLDYKIIADILMNVISRVLPIPFGGDSDEQEKWNTLVFETVLERFALVCGLNDSHPLRSGARKADKPQSINETHAPGSPAEQDHSTNVADDNPQQDNSREASVENEPNETPAPLEELKADKVKEGKAIPTPEDEGYQLPNPETLQKFHALAVQANFTSNPEMVREYLMKKFGVPAARSVHGPALDTLISWLEGQQNPVETFRSIILKEVQG